MELIAGMTFTGNKHCFTGRVEVLEIDEPNNILKVRCTHKLNSIENEFHSWYEDWNLQHVRWGFESGEYFIKNFPDYPQDLQRSTEQQCNIPRVSKRALTTTEIVQKWPDGTEEVKYRRPYGSDEAKELMNQVDERACKDGYFYRHVC